MDTEIIVAIIGAAAAIVAAIIGVWGKKKKTADIEQKVSGNGNTVIGTQINKNSEQLEKLQNTVEALQKDMKKPELVTVELPNKAGGTTVIIGASESEILQAVEKELAEI